MKAGPVCPYSWDHAPGIAGQPQTRRDGTGPGTHLPRFAGIYPGFP